MANKIQIYGLIRPTRVSEKFATGKKKNKPSVVGDLRPGVGGGGPEKKPRR